MAYSYSLIRLDDRYSDLEGLVVERRVEDTSWRNEGVVLRVMRWVWGVVVRVVRERDGGERAEGIFVLCV